MNAQNAAPKTWSDLDPYLKANHLPTGKAVPATVERIEFTTVHPRPGQEEIKPVMFFQAKNKGLILTATNQKFIRATFGEDITASYGKAVTLMAISKKIAGKMIDTIIIGLPDQKPAQTRTTPAYVTDQVAQTKEEQTLTELGYPPK